jgi:hypothetical protein
MSVVYLSSSSMPLIVEAGLRDGTGASAACASRPGWYVPTRRFDPLPSTVLWTASSWSRSRQPVTDDVNDRCTLLCCAKNSTTTRVCGCGGTTCRRQFDDSRPPDGNLQKTSTAKENRKQESIQKLRDYPGSSSTGIPCIHRHFKAYDWVKECNGYRYAN